MKSTFISLLSVLLLSTYLYAQQPVDCSDAVTVCGNSNINLDVNGIGTQEITGLNSCSSQENNSLWLSVTTITDGTLGFTLTPSSTAIVEDYDFFVFGPNVACNNLGQAIRCSTTNPQASGQGNNLTGMNDTETDVSEGPGANGNSFVRWLDVQAGDTYFIVIDRPIGNSPFSLEWTGTAEFADPPVNETPTTTSLNLEQCDSSFPYDDNIDTFDFSVNSALILGTQTNTVISYHLSESDANINTNAITPPFTTTTNPQSIFYRLTNTITGCFIVDEFTLTINPGPNFNNPTPLEVCDDFQDGDSSNGFSTFTLTDKTAEITENIAEDITVTYHETLADAENSNNPITEFYTNNTDVFVRIEKASDSSCFNTATFQLIVSPTPAVNNYTLLQCDKDGLPDGFTTYNLLQAQDQIANGITDATFSFYITLADLTNDEDVITTPEAFENWSNPQTLYVKVTDTNSNCSAISELTLQQSNTAINDYEHVTCDELDSEDGINTIDLSTIESNMQTENGITFPILFFETYQDALLEQNPLGNSYTNTTAYNQTIYARTENDNACYGIAEVTLTINPLPQLEEDNTAYYCLNNFPTPTVINSGVINFIPNFYFFEWSSGEDTIEIEVNETGTYTVTVTNVLGCEKSRTITVEASNIATIDNIVVNDGNYNNTNTLTVLTSGEGDYEYALYDIYGNEYLPYQSSNSFTDVYPGIYTVLVKDVKNDCGIAENDISVIGFPKFITPNADGYNDTWQVRGLSTQFQPNSKIYIFDRNGKLLSELEPLSAGWDGNYKGKPMPADDYWFSVTLQDGRTFKNHFSLKR